MKLHTCERKITIALDDFGKDRDFLQRTIEEDMSCIYDNELGVKFDVGAPTNNSTWYDVVMIIDMLRSTFSDAYDIVDVGFDDNCNNDEWGWLSFSIMRPRNSDEFSAID